ncbi:MAG: hypothetical protein R3D69_13190 [Xanthobacteraceae bacterium]
MVVTDRQHLARTPAEGKAGPPSFEQRMYSPHSIASIVAELSAQRRSADDVLSGTGLSAEQLADHTTKVSYRQLDRVMRNAQELSIRSRMGFARRPSDACLGLWHVWLRLF